MLCDICLKAEATHFDKVIENGVTISYKYCDGCYAACLKSGRLPRDVARQRMVRRGLECESCGYTAEELDDSFYLGCPDCYRSMRAKLRRTAGDYARKFAAEPILPPRISEEELRSLSMNAVSSRIRLARNVEGLRFPRKLGAPDERIADFMRKALLATAGVFDGELYTMTALDKLRKKALIELHTISLPLANSDLGAVIIEKGEDPEISVMLNEEDHIREQCVKDGFCLLAAYDRLKAYDDALKRELDIAYDPEFGYLTACPSNVGAGMRASVMLFLPALKRTGAIGEALRAFERRYGVTVRGYFGEGSEGAYDMYQLSNTVSYMKSEYTVLKEVESVAIELMRLEREALVALVQAERSKLVDRIFRSYGALTSAYTLPSEELMEKLSDVKLGVILDVLPIKQMRPLNKLIWACASSFEILTEGATEEQRNIARADIVRSALAEVK